MFATIGVMPLTVVSTLAGSAQMIASTLCVGATSSLGAKPIARRTLPCEDDRWVLTNRLDTEETLTGSVRKVLK